jgi:hypothetical protein
MRKLIFTLTLGIFTVLPVKADSDESVWNSIAATGISTSIMMQTLEQGQEADRAYYAAYPPAYVNPYNTKSAKAGRAFRRALGHLFKAF